MKKLILILLVISILSMPVFADVNKYPSEQMIKNYFPIGCTWWKAKLNMAQLSLDYNLTNIHFGGDPSYCMFPEMEIILDINPSGNKQLDIELDFNGNKLVNLTYEKWIRTDEGKVMRGNF